mmetsp:Transcript_52389/g.152288  ORF Transcript_52389/g.152288 Transcript_52389/m.152288 type:complete len:106 (+) Transcript_52389:1101-1418(+)
MLQTPAWSRLMERALPPLVLGHVGSGSAAGAGLCAEAAAAATVAKAGKAANKSVIQEDHGWRREGALPPARSCIPPGRGRSPRPLRPWRAEAPGSGGSRWGGGVA